MWQRVQRTGWVRKGVKRPESVADHMYRMAMMAMLAPPGLDVNKCIKMALVHDMAECIVGDLTPHDSITKEEKHKAEEAAMKEMCTLVGDGTGDQLLALWQDYEEQVSEEAKFVKDLDKLDMVMQAYEYEQLEERPKFLQEFFDSTEGKFVTDTGCAWKEHLDALRKNNVQNLFSDTELPNQKT
ncbi:hypothetical protein C0Q70_07352 [Pomacea canaliculata]|uniref:5'-deoxynucleotidase HDDC2 n=1 Tax=Pomacea canaliculata TaxID=400727 RepID=A0A2T7PET9_POMCA|nr:hypothetical protein C0Q70_07352 [Pomacea canaliculata]